MRRALALLLLALLLPARIAAAGVADDEREARVAGVCVGSGSGSATLRLKAEDGRLEVRFRVAHAGIGSWRVVLVHESKVDWRGASRTTLERRSFEVRRLLRDLPGTDTVTARSWGPGGRSCRASATVA